VTRLQGTLELATQSRWYGRPAEASGWPFPATPARTRKSPLTTRPAGIDFYYWELDVIILGIILLIIGFLAHIAIVWTIGIIVVVVGAILALLGMMGHAVGGRRHYF
jgi:small-conductance mechanosensitive channel